MKNNVITCVLLFIFAIWIDAIYTDLLTLQDSVMFLTAHSNLLYLTEQEKTESFQKG